MRVVTFFILLCLLLLKVNAAVLSGDHPSSALHSLTQHVKKTQLEIEYRFGMDAENEDEDEDGNNEFTKKYRLLNGLYSILSCPSLLSNLHSYSKVITPFSGRSSYIYITQRALKI